VRHHVVTTALGNLDDWLDDFFPQASSQWDALAHVGDPGFGRYIDRLKKEGAHGDSTT
jgi:hypothetical protein